MRKDSLDEDFFSLTNKKWSLKEYSEKDAEYISQRLYAYQNRETVGAMSATMWAQAGMLSDNDIQTLSEFIEETMK